MAPRLRERVVNTGQEDIAFSYRTELARKAIHLTSIVIPIFFYLTPRTQALLFLIPATLLVIAIDVGRPTPCVIRGRGVELCDE